MIWFSREWRQRRANIRLLRALASIEATYDLPGRTLDDVYSLAVMRARGEVAHPSPAKHTHELGDYDSIDVDLRWGQFFRCRFENCLLVYDHSSFVYMRGCYLLDCRWKNAVTGEITADTPSFSCGYLNLTASTRETRE